MPVSNALQVDFKNGHVQDDIFAGGTGFISSESMVIAVKKRNPDTHQEIGASDDLENFIAVGLIENINLNQQKQIQQLFEIGSRDPYFIPGRVLSQAGINRVIFDGDSLLRVLYPTYSSDSDNGASMPDYDETVSSWDGTNPPGSNEAGKGDLWFNLASEFFNTPFTMAIVFYNDQTEIRGYIVLESCYVEAHNLAAQAAQTVVVESARMRIKKIASYGAFATKKLF